MNTILDEKTLEDLRAGRVCAVDADTLARAAEIVRSVDAGGERALLEWSMRLGDLQEGERWRFGPDEMRDAYERLSEGDRAVLDSTAGRIRAFAGAQRASVRDVDVAVPGGRAGHTVKPVAAAGCYAPGGRYPLPSSVLMTAVTARAAGVGRVVVASPRPTDVTLAAAAVAGADELLAVGGAQAVAALAYGVESVDPVDVIVGPGNVWVTAAKKVVSGDVRIDMLAGPSELLVVADDNADAGTVAADLIAQAEHDPDAVPSLVAFSDEVVEAVRREVLAQLETLPSREVARAAFDNSYAVVAGSREEAVAVCDVVAPEHLQVMVENASAFGRRLTNYGGLFIGSRSAEVFGDYGLGPNHVLPTGGTGRFAGGLSVKDFLVTRTWLELDEAGGVVDEVARLARLEGLEGHARAAERRQ